MEVQNHICAKCGYPMMCNETLDEDLFTPVRIWLCVNVECDADEIVEPLDRFERSVGQVPGQMHFA